MKVDEHGNRYHGIHINLTKPKFKKLATGGSITVKHTDFHPPSIGSSLGATYTWLPEHLAEKVKHSMKKQKSTRLKLEPHEIQHNAMYGSGWWDEVVDFGKKTINVVANNILPVISQIADALPISHPYFIAFKAGLKIVENLTKKLDSVVNKKEQAELEALEAEELYLDKKSESNQPGISAAQKSKLLQQAQQAKDRIKLKQQQAKALDKEAKKLTKDKAAADKKAKLAESKALAAANQLKKR
jgi:hypothetical protein